jgi:hypothetical protein
MKNTQKGARCICQRYATQFRACFRSIFAAGCPILSPTQSQITVSINSTSVEDNASQVADRAGHKTEPIATTISPIAA